MINHIPFYYVRHGQTDWNLNKRLQGNSDIPLNETGIAQAHAAKDKMFGTSIATICCSPLIRARKTADIINTVLNTKIIEIDELKECDFGDREGTLNNTWIDNWLAGDDSTAPEGIEKYDAFIARATAAINKATAHDGPVLIVAHGGVYIPANNTLSPNEQWSLPNAQPVLHTPPQAGVRSSDQSQQAHWTLKIL